MSPFVNIVTDLIKMLLVGLLAKFGLDIAAHSGDISAVAGEIGEASVTALVTLALVLWKWVQHTKLWNEVPDGPVATSEGVNGGQGDKVTGGAGNSTLGGSLNSLMLFVGLLVFVTSCFVACAKNETNRAAQGMIAVQTHAANVDWLITTGTLTDETEIKKLQTLIHAEQAASNSYYAAIKAGDSAALATAKAALATAAAAAGAELAKFPAPPPPPPLVLPTTTTPATAASTK